MNMFRHLKENIGPGLLFTASAVGVSHLVQSTRGGAAYGTSILFIIVFICLLKYPLFLFGAWYTAVTGETIIEGYRRVGRWILYVILFVYLFELPFAIAGISVVSAGVLKTSLDIQVNDGTFALVLVGLSLLLSTFGRYQVLENTARVFVALFLVCIVIGAGITVTSNINDFSLGQTAIAATGANLMFLVALSGWMPVGVGGAIGVSLWIHAKNKRLGRNLALREVRLDFNISYAVVIIAACCFALMGAYTLYSGSNGLEGNSVEFTERLFAIFTQAFAPWVHILIIIGANVVLISSLLIVVDLLPRLGTALVQSLYPVRFGGEQPRLFAAFVVYELLSVYLVIVLLLRSFTGFIDMVTSLGFLAIPIIAWLNHKAVFSGSLPAGLQPSNLLRYWNIAAILLSALVSLAYVGLSMMDR
jgi:Mn2+/Fe2+ NRAMP family transporter